MNLSTQMILLFLEAKLLKNGSITQIATAEILQIARPNLSSHFKNWKKESNLPYYDSGKKKWLARENTNSSFFNTEKEAEIYLTAFNLILKKSKSLKPIYAMQIITSETKNNLTSAFVAISAKIDVGYIYHDALAELASKEGVYLFSYKITRLERLKKLVKNYHVTIRRIEEFDFSFKSSSQIKILN